jgi:RNA polymerase sigma-70 factor (ECF subfamily)
MDVDEQLLARAKHDPRAFGDFYARHDRAVFRYFYRRVQDAEVAADLSAECFAAGAGHGAPRDSRRWPSSASWP